MPARSSGASRRSDPAAARLVGVGDDAALEQVEIGIAVEDRDRALGGEMAAPAWRVRRSRVDCRSQSRSIAAVSRSSAPSIAASPAQRESASIRS